VPINADDINAKLKPLGYVYFRSDVGGHHVSALYGHAYNKYFETDDELREFIERVEQSDQWELHHATGAVDVDHTGTITPDDGSAPYDARTVADGYSGSGPRMKNMPKDAAHAESIFIRTVERPQYGGNWYKQRPGRRIP
jgi:hypothetical protein